MRPRTAALLIGLAAWIAFAWRLGVPGIMVFDETHYVPAARALLRLEGPTNIEHPLLAKLFMAAGMALAGDNAVGWRLFSPLAGAATVTAVFGITHLALGRLRSSVTAAALAVLGFTVFVQARIAMLDGYMVAFLAGGTWLVAWALRAGGWGRWLGGAAMLGLATACKWTAAPYVGFAALAFLFVRRERPASFPGLPPLPAVLAFGAVAVLAYFLTFAPAFFYARDPLTLAGLIPFQLEMYARQTQVLSPHIYQSNWWTWPLLIRPIWYLYEPVAGVQRGIIMLCNPAVAWGGLVAVAACLYGWVRTGALTLLAPAALWLGSLAIWAAIPKSLGFFYYYYPSTVFLPIAIAVAMHHWRLDRGGRDEVALAFAAGLFAYFYPVLAATPLDGPQAFQRYTWFDSWI